MALVGYSDSEDSDTDAPAATSLPPPKPIITKPPLSTGVDGVGRRKIKVELPALKSEPGQIHDEAGAPPATKRARTAGAFSGFNSLLPAPKRAAQSGPRPGVSLKTSSEAAFSRHPVSQPDPTPSVVDVTRNEGVTAATESTSEPKIVGKATRFKPLSVANKKKPTTKKKDVTTVHQDSDAGVKSISSTADSDATTRMLSTKEDLPPPAPKSKRSLFSMPTAPDPELASDSADQAYQPITIGNDASSSQPIQIPQLEFPNTAQNSSLQAIASDLNLTSAQRRQLFGRNSKAIDIAHFDMDAEYAANEEMRQAGEVVEHRAVKAIAPGKHSLQQLVNNARSQQDNLEDKWAQGRRERGGMGRGR